MTRDIAISLREELAHFDQWALLQKRNDDGWESFYPRWPDLISLADAAMRAPLTRSETLLSDIARVWDLSEETEDLVERVADENVDADLLECISRRCRPEGRFQIVSIAGSIPGLGVPVLVRMLDDADAYVVRRALLALAHTDPSEAAHRARLLITHGDDMVRTIANRITNGQPLA